MLLGSEWSLAQCLSKAQEITIRIHHQKFPPSKQDLPLSIPMFCWLGKKRVMVVLQGLEQDVKRIYQHSKIDSASIWILKLSRFPASILLFDHKLASLIR